MSEAYDTPGYFVAGPCYGCGRVFTFNPHLVPSIPIDPVTRMPADMGGNASRTVRQPVCEDCVSIANANRAAEGRPLIDVLPGAYDAVEGLFPD